MTTQIDIARAYVDALLTHDGDSVPFAPDAVRYENGLKTGRSGNGLRRSLSRGPQYRVIRAIREFEATLDADTVHTAYLLDIGLFARWFTVRIREDFLIPQDLHIHRIQAHINLP